MRKLIAVLMMIFVVLFFYSSLQNRNSESKSKKEMSHIIEDIEEVLEGKYPESPMEIMEINNTVINMIYGKELTEGEIERAVAIQRKLYAEVFLALNPLESHMLEIDREITMNKEKEIKIIGSKVMSAYNDQPGNMKVQVVHYTNKQDQDLIREYILKEETGVKSTDEKRWKIYGWTNIGIAKTQEEAE